MIDIFKIILDEQNNDKFRKNCLIMRIIDNENYENYKDFYLPYYIVKIINDKLIEESIIEIKNNIEMYGALIEFIKDIVYEKKNIKIQKDIDIWKYEISKMLNCNYYIIFEYEGYKDVIELIMKISSINYRNELLNKCLKYSSHWYYLKSKYTDIPDSLFYDKQMFLTINKYYDLRIIQHFSDVSYTDKNTNIIINNIVRDNNLLWKIQCKIKKHKSDLSNIEHFETYGYLIKISHDKQIVFSGLYDYIIDNQDHISLQYRSCLVHFINHQDYTSSIYLPIHILTSLDSDYYSAMVSDNFKVGNFEFILTETESYDGFLLFLQDLLSSNRILTIDSLFDFHKYAISYRFNHHLMYRKLITTYTFPDFNKILVDVFGDSSLFDSINSLPTYLT